MYKTMNERVRNLIKRVVTSSFALVLIIAVIGALALLADVNSRTVVYDCVSHPCSVSLASDLQSSSSNLVQDFDVMLNLHVKPKSQHDSSQSALPAATTVPGLVNWNSIPGGKTYVYIPMRFGSNPEFGYEAGNTKTLDSIRVRVVGSRQFYIYINGEIAYTHRYQLPVFYSDPSKLMQAATPDSGFVSSTTVTKSVIYQESNSLQRLANLLFMIFGGLFSWLVCLLLLRKFAYLDRKPVPERKYRMGAWVGLWIISLIPWVMAPTDPTGANNPGPFGPIGAAFSDYFQIAQASHFSQPYNFSAVDYPPFALAFLKSLSYLLPGLLGFAVIAALCLGVLSFMFLHVTRTSSGGSRFRNILTFLAPYPLLFGIVRGNLDLLAVTLVWMAILARNSKYAIWSAIFLASAVSLKVWPIVFVFFFLRWGKKNIVLSAAGITLFLTFISPFLLGYRSISQIIHVTFTSLSSAAAISADGFHYTFSISALFYFGHIFFLSANPVRPNELDLNSALSFANSGIVKVLIGFIVLLLIGMIWKSKTMSRSYLFCSGLALLISTPTFTYRGVILIAYFYFVWQESATRPNMRSQLNNENPFSVVQAQDRWVASLTRAREFAWLPILAPATFLFFGHNFKDEQLSLASILQPGCLVTLLALEAGLLKLEEGSQSAEPITGSSPANFLGGITPDD